MKRMIRALASFVGLAALVGCGGGTQPTPRAIQLSEAFAATADSFQNRRTAPPALTREILDGLDGSFMEVTIEDTGALGYLYLQAVRRDSFPGTVRLWRSEDNVSFAMRQGVLVQVRGFGNDILATNMRLSSNVIGPAGDGPRSMSILGLDNKSVALEAACDVGNQGAERITIIGRSYNTQHIVERCEFATGQIQNDYWVDSSSGIVWQSRQWGGPDNGYFKFRRLTR